MIKKLTESERKKMLSLYNRRENQNRHSENAVMLIKRFGSKKDKKEARDAFKRFEKSSVGISSKDYHFFYKRGHALHFNKLAKPIKK